MKTISNMLGRGNLTPRERYLLLIHSDIQKSKTGKDALTEADKKALENWRAQNNSESREWNELNEGWKYSGRMDIETEFIYKDGHIAYLAQLPIIIKLLYYPSYREMEGYINSLKRIKKVSVEEAVEIAHKQKEVKLKGGLDFDYAIYQLAFELLSQEDKKCMKELYVDIEFDHQYLDQEEIIANLYGDKNELSQKVKEKLSKLVAENSYNKFAKEYQLFHYFACIPLLEVARHFLKNHGVEIPGEAMLQNQESRDEDENVYEEVTEAMKKYAEEKGKTIKSMLEDGCLHWLDRGLLEEYTPLATSNKAELLKRWFKTKIKAKEILSKHIDSGELKISSRTPEETRKEKLYSKDIYDVELESARIVLENGGREISVKGELDEKIAFEKFSDSIITGESLYHFRENYEFVRDFRKRVDNYEPNLGIVYKDNDPDQKGEHVDQELLICGLTNKSDADVFSVYGLSIRILSNFFKGKLFFEEFSEDGKKFIKFEDDEIDKAFRERQKDLINCYAGLLSFEKMFKKISKIYEIDMAEHVVGRLALVREHIEQSNEAVRSATNAGEDKSKKTKHDIFRRKEVLQFKESLIINIDSIVPDQKIIDEHEKKLREIFGDF